MPTSLISKEDLEEFFAQTPTPMCIFIGRELRYAMANQEYLKLIQKSDV